MVLVELGKVDSEKDIIELAFNRARERTKLFSQKKKKYDTKLAKQIALKSYKVDVFVGTLHSKLVSIIHAFPSFSDLDPFYQELVKSTMDYVALKKSLGAVDWGAKQVQKFNREYQRKLRGSKSVNDLSKHEKSAYGRMSSVLKQIKGNLKYLDEVRKTLKTFPAIKTGLKTIVVVGFPNVGKTTFLYKLTGSKPEINSYAFTTKTINVGYFTKDNERLQVLDTPGTLNRFEVMNSIEKQAWLCLTHLADVVIYVFDLTESYPLKDQEKMYKKVKREVKAPLLIYLSKKDLLDKKVIDEFSRRYKKVLDVDEIREYF